MRRRKYLAAVGLVTSLGLAGCSGGTGGNNSSGGSGGGTQAGDAGGGTEPSGGATEAGGVETTASDGGGATTGGTGGATEAETTAASGGGEATTTSSESGGEETTSSSGDSSSGSSSITDSGETDVELREAQVDDGLSLDSAAFYIEDDGFSSGVRGEVTNTSDSSIGYLEINALFYDSEGSRLGDGLDNLNDFQAGETYKYDAFYLGSNDASQIASYTLEVTSGF